MFDFMDEEDQNNLKAPTIIFNTFELLETEALQALVSKFNYTNVYPIDPLPSIARPSYTWEKSNQFIQFELVRF